MDVGGVVMGAIGLLLTGPLAHVVTKQASVGHIDVSSAIGIRTRTTTSSREAWQVAHRAALPWVSAAALLSVVTAVLSLTAVLLMGPVGVGALAPLVLLGTGYVGLLLLLSVATTIGGRAVRAAGLGPRS
jgi:hypothetical protein